MAKQTGLLGVIFKTTAGEKKKGKKSARGKFWPPASSCSHVFVPADENHTDCRADVLADRHMEALQPAARGTFRTQLPTASILVLPGFAAADGTPKPSPLSQLLRFPSPDLPQVPQNLKVQL